jgi:hypothetical protein
MLTFPPIYVIIDILYSITRIFIDDIIYRYSYLSVCLIKYLINCIKKNFNI